RPEIGRLRCVVAIGEIEGDLARRWRGHEGTCRIQALECCSQVSDIALDRLRIAQGDRSDTILHPRRRSRRSSSAWREYARKIGELRTDQWTALAAESGVPIEHVGAESRLAELPVSNNVQAHLALAAHHLTDGGRQAGLETSRVIAAPGKHFEQVAR